MFSGRLQMVSPLRVDSRWSFVNVSIGNCETGSFACHEVAGQVPSAVTFGHDQVFRLAGSSPPLAGRVETSIRPNVLRLLQRLTDLPALVQSAKGDVLAQNPMSKALVGDLSR